MEKKIIQITSGKGPAECCRVVARVQALLLKDAKARGIEIEALSSQKGELKETLLSATLLVQGRELESFLKEWQGTVQWVSQSPYRIYHKRKNWFVGVEVFDLPEKVNWDPRDVVFETLRGSGPGGQNVNKVETAVRGRHLPSGIQVLAMDSRSQLQNRKLCLERLQAKVQAWEMEQLTAGRQSQWQEHNCLERGNPVKTFKERL